VVGKWVGVADFEEKKTRKKVLKKDKVIKPKKKKMAS
jgi:hypothetical protein